MVGFLFRSILGTRNQRLLKKLKPIVEKINLLEEHVKKLPDEAFRKKTIEFKERLERGSSLDDILPEAFAFVREAARRTIGLRHFDVQLLGGIVLHQGKIAEMKTGEGKTLVATLPAYLHALKGYGVHIVTVNDYLAKRDRFWMGPIYEYMGLKVDYIQHEWDQQRRKQAYMADVVYVTNSEIGFDYLRDNMVTSIEDRVLRYYNKNNKKFYYAIVDEVDSILIDEARTPLIISGPAEESTEKYYIANQIVKHLKGRSITDEDEIRARVEKINLGVGYDFLYDEKHHTVTLTDDGMKKVEKMLNVESIYDVGNGWSHYITQAIRAHIFFKKDVDYVVKDGEVIIVDEFTGRLMPGRRWSDGLHQAIEAKEGLKIKEENQTLATITYQNFFRLYERLAGMTGTAMTEVEEFWEIYRLDVVEIPTNKPMIRIDYPDVVFKTEKAKFKAIIEEIEENYKKGRPVLVGTRSIEKSEYLANELRKRGIPCQVLNAKYHEQEAQIIAQAGRSHTITIATNMAGRGTDIILGGNPQDPLDYEKVKSLGGLHIIGTERHEARRIDNQLRGRAGRQGDPGSSRFYLSLEDELMRIFGGPKIAEIMAKLGQEIPEDERIESKILTKQIEMAQRRIEAMNFDIRKQLLEYDNVMNTQREVIYNLRDRILAKEQISDVIDSMLDELIEDLKETYKNEPLKLSEISKRLFGCDIEYAKKKLHEKREKFKEEFVDIERRILLFMIDNAWKENLYELDHLKKGIHLRAYGQKDPKIEYKKEAFALFENMMRRIRDGTIEYIMNIIPQKVEEREKVYAEIKRKIGRNDPCPCGSGKKYKKCHGVMA
ncbi:MAG: preprotein translocase subunit SecA [bacterium]|nr:preprotein translocase subunit SecA [bacterium]